MFCTPDGRAVETDVAVIGTGPGGMAAVAGAVEAGADVVAVEAADRIGGNAIWSTGYLAFVDSAAQRERGIADSVERFVADADAIVESVRSTYGVVWDRELAHLFARRSAATYRDLVERGVRFTRFIPRPLQHTVDRLLAVEDTAMLADAFRPEFDGPRTRTFLQASAEHLLVRDGAVVGLRATTTGGTPFEVHARRGVVLAAGGYQANPEVRRRYQPEVAASERYLGIDTCRGDAHLMGQAVGGDLVNMTMIPALVIVASALLEDCIAVNRAGRRFHDETGVYQHRVDALRAQDGQWAYYLLDADTARHKEQYLAQMPEPAVSADTLPELAELLGVPAAELVASVDRWNELLASDAARDPDTGRVSFPMHRRGIVAAPFSAVRMLAGTSISGGGFVVTSSMQVVDVHGRPIPGLFAVGDCAGGLNPCHELGGTHISGGLTLGRVAGHAVAAGETAPAHTCAPFGRWLPSTLQSRVELVHVEPSR